MPTSLTLSNYNPYRLGTFYLYVKLRHCLIFAQFSVVPNATSALSGTLCQQKDKLRASYYYVHCAPLSAKTKLQLFHFSQSQLSRIQTRETSSDSSKNFILVFVSESKTLQKCLDSKNYKKMH